MSLRERLRRLLRGDPPAAPTALDAVRATLTVSEAEVQRVVDRLALAQRVRADAAREEARREASRRFIEDEIRKGGGAWIPNRDHDGGFGRFRR